MRLRLFRLLTIFVTFLMVFVFGCTNGDPYINYTFIDITHIINPLSGMPYSVFFNEELGRYENYDNHIISATIISPSSMEGDGYSTAVCVMGVDKAKAFIEERMLEGKITAALLFTQDKKMLVFGELFGFNKDDLYSDYKSFETAYGAFSDYEEGEAIPIPSGSYSRYVEFAFSETIEFEIYIFDASTEKKNRVKEEIMLRIEELDKQINVANSESDLSKLNRAQAGEDIQIGFDAYTLLVESKRIYEESGHAFNIGLSPLSRLWGVDIDGIASYNSIGSKKNWIFPSSLPTVDEINQQLQYTDLEDLIVYENENGFFARKNNAHLELELGGIAKGYAVDICAKILAENEVQSAQLNISGNIYEFGRYFNTTTERKSTWKIGVTNPVDKHNLFKGIICAIEVEGNTSIVTSGDYERFYSFGYENGQ